MDASSSMGKYCEDIIEKALTKAGFITLSRGENTKYFRGRMYPKKNDLDFIAYKEGVFYGIEVKKGFPRKRDFKQAERYLGFLNGIFLAYPADTVGQAVYISELKESSYPDIGLISLALWVNPSLYLQPYG